MVAIDNRKYTREEYFELLAASEGKLEYHHGHIVAMGFGNSDSSRIAVNISRRISEKIEDTDCVLFDSSIALELDEKSRYTFTNATVVGGEPIFSDHNENVLTNPILIVEVLSENTDKFRFYRGIPSLNRVSAPKISLLISNILQVIIKFYL